MLLVTKGTVMDIIPLTVLLLIVEDHVEERLVLVGRIVKGVTLEPYWSC